MRARSLGLAFAALLVLGRTAPGYAKDAASKSPSAAQSPTVAPAEAPVSVPRPSIAAKTAEPAPATTEEAKPRRHRRHARLRYTHWQPFPIYRWFF